MLRRVVNHTVELLYERHGEIDYFDKNGKLVLKVVDKAEFHATKTKAAEAAAAELIAEEAAEREQTALAAAKKRSTLRERGR